MFGSVLDLPLDLLISVLVRLPHRHLLKCMFVSKSFCAIIRQPKFIQAYCMHYPICLLLTLRGTDDQNPRSIHCCNLIPSGSGGQPEFFHLKNLSPPVTETNARFSPGCRVTAIINGVLCYYSFKWAILVNVFSGEVNELPSAHSNIGFYLGFDPIDCACKLLRTSFSRHQDLEFHILTISGTAMDLSWRKLPPSSQDPSHPLAFVSDSVSVNGCLYWIESVNQDLSMYKIISFDLTTEMFRSFTLNIDRERVRIESPILAQYESLFLDPRHLVQFRGKLSLFPRVGKEPIVLNTLELMDDSNVYNWSQHRIILADEFWDPNRGNCAIPIGNSPGGNLLMANPNPNIRCPITPVYAYNHETNQFMRFVAPKFPERIRWREQRDISLHVSAVEQNINMLDALISQFSPKYW